MKTLFSLLLVSLLVTSAWAQSSLSPHQGKAKTPLRLENRHPQAPSFGTAPSERQVSRGQNGRPIPHGNQALAPTAAGPEDTITRVLNFPRTYAATGNGNFENITLGQPLAPNTAQVLVPDTGLRYIREIDFGSGPVDSFAALFEFSSFGMTFDPYYSAYDRPVRDDRFFVDGYRINFGYERYSETYIDTIRTTITYPRYRLDSIDGFAPQLFIEGVNGNVDTSYVVFLNDSVRVDSVPRQSRLLIEFEDDGNTVIPKDTIPLFPSTNLLVDTSVSPNDTSEEQLPPRRVDRFEQESFSFVRITIDPDAPVVDTLFVTFARTAWGLRDTEEGCTVFDEQGNSLINYVGAIPGLRFCQEYDDRDYPPFGVFDRRLGRYTDPVGNLGAAIRVDTILLTSEDTATLQINNNGDVVNFNTEEILFSPENPSQGIPVQDSGFAAVSVSFKPGNNPQPGDTIGYSETYAQSLEISQPANPTNAFFMVLYEDATETNFDNPQTASTGNGAGLHFGMEMPLEHRHQLDSARADTTADDVDNPVQVSLDEFINESFPFSAAGFGLELPRYGHYIPTEFLSGGAFPTQFYPHIELIVRDDLSVSTEDRTASSTSGGLELYPNPTAGQLHLRFTADASSPTQAEIYDVLGKRVRTQDMGMSLSGRQQRQLDVSGLEEGVYFLRLRSGHQVETARFVVGH